MRLLPVIALAVLTAVPAIAQQPQPARPAPGQIEADPGSARFRLADSYIRAQQFDRAIAILEDLLNESPDSLPVADRLKDAYVGARRFDDAIGLMEDRIARHGRQISFVAEIGSIHMAAGDRHAADAAWNEVLRIAPDQVQTYRMLYSVLIQNRLWERARDVLLTGRERLSSPELFRNELAELYSRTNQHAEALQEWAATLVDDEARMTFVQSRMSRLLDQEAAGDAFKTALDRLIRREPTVLPYRRLAAWLAAETGDFASGLDHLRAVDRLGRETGQSLLGFAESALQAQQFAVAEQALEIILDRHGDTSTGATALISSALLFEQLGARAAERPAGDAGRAPNYVQAANRYNRFLERHPHHPAAPVAMRRLAELRRDVFLDFDRAEELLHEVIRRFPDTSEAHEARLALGELAILRDDLPAARVAFTRLDNDLRTGDRAQRARFALAELDFYEGNFEMARTRTDAMKRNTSTDVSNNAIDLKLLLTENQGPDSLATPLRSFATSELRQRQHRPEEALDLLDGILRNYAGHSVIPLARFRRAVALRALDRPDEALAELQSIPEKHPDSYLADRALFLAAEVIEQDHGDMASAVEAYTAFLMRYPGSLLAPEARTRIRRLRGDLPRS